MDGRQTVAASERHSSPLDGTLRETHPSAVMRVPAQAGFAQTWPARALAAIVRHRMFSPEHAECRSTRPSTRDPSAVVAGST
jgi:hypothetical protein